MLVVDVASEDADGRNIARAFMAELVIQLMDVTRESSEIIELPVRVGDLILTARAFRSVAWLPIACCPPPSSPDGFFFSVSFVPGS
jgi:hypothetical protein